MESKKSTLWLLIIGVLAASTLAQENHQVTSVGDSEERVLDTYSRFKRGDLQPPGRHTRNRLDLQAQRRELIQQQQLEQELLHRNQQQLLQLQQRLEQQLRQLQQQGNQPQPYPELQPVHQRVPLHVHMAAVREVLRRRRLNGNPVLPSGRTSVVRH